LEQQCVVRAGLALVVMLSVSSFILAEKYLSEPRQHGCDHDHGGDIGDNYNNEQALSARLS